MEPALFTKREVLEGQTPEMLLELRTQLEAHIAIALGGVALITDVLIGYGLPYDEAQFGVYDASQDDYQTTEHPEDDRWVVRGTN